MDTVYGSQIPAGARQPHVRQRQGMQTRNLRGDAALGNGVSGHLKDLTGFYPLKSDPQWKKIPVASGSQFCTGIALRWRLLRRVRLAIRVRGRFPQLGWLKLDAVAIPTGVDPVVEYLEGGRQVRE